MQTIEKSPEVKAKMLAAAMRKRAAQAPAPQQSSSATAPAQAPQEIRPISLASSSFWESKNTMRHFDLPPGTKREDLAAPALYSVVAPAHCKPGDIAWCFGENFVGEVFFRVAGAGLTTVVVVMRIIDLPPIKYDTKLVWPAGYEARFDVQWGAWFVHRIKDGWRMTAEPGQSSLPDLHAQFVNSAIFR